MLQDPHTIEPSLDLILVSRHLERIGDHATNVAEDVIFMVSARDVRHHADERRARTHRSTRSSPNPIRLGGLGTSDGALCVYCRQKPVDPAWRPFCSERCKMADLGRG